MTANVAEATQRELLAQLLRQRASREYREMPLSSGQKALWFLHQSAPASAAYHIAYCCWIHSALDVERMRGALQAVLDRHPALRTTFHAGAQGPVQRVVRHQPVAFQVVPAADAEETVLQSARAAYEIPFDLELGPLFRATFFQRRDDSGLFLLTVHHLVFDGWSLWSVLEELGQLYGAPAIGQPARLAALQADYEDYVSYQQTLLDSPEGARLWKFWQDKLAGEAPVLKLPSDLARPAVMTFNGASEKVRLSKGLSYRVRQLARQQGVTPYVLLLTAFQVLLYRYSGQQDLWIGSPVAGREAGKFASTVGYFVNPVVIRSQLEKGAPFSTQLATTRDAVMAALEHQAFPFPVLVERLCPTRDPSHSPLFQVSFVLQKDQGSHGITSALAGGTERRVNQWGGLSVEPVDFAQQEGQFDLELELLDGECFGGAFKYNRDVFDAAGIREMVASFVALLEGIVDNADAQIDKLPLLSAAQRAKSERLHTPRTDFPVCREPLHCGFERCAAATPDAIALKCGQESLTYRELNERANTLAHFLVAQGVGPEVKVGISVERSLDMIVGILGILKAGGAYVPIDPASPEDRIAFIAEDSAVPLLLTQHAIAGRFAHIDARIVQLDSEWPAIASYCGGDMAGRASVDNLAYVIYTSGTTGKPKGVQVTHFNVRRLFDASHHWYGFHERDIWTLFHSFAFDVSVWEMWGAFLYGGRLIVVPQSVTRASFEFVELVREEGVTVLCQTPSAFRIFMEAEARAPLGEASRLRYVIFAGEALDVQSLRPWFDRYGDLKPRLVNMYGITETTVHSTYREITRADLRSGRSMIGVPIPDLRIYLLDENRQPVPRGVAGEIYVGGDGVARGYLARPELDAQRFLPDPFSAVRGARMYKSGDAARYHANGDLEYLGRLDRQVKIRGFRIELGEIEAALGQLDSIQSVFVRVSEAAGGDKRLVAYYIAADGHAPEVSALRAYLSGTLPAYMVPSFFVELDVLPLTGNGKLDERALPAPELHGRGEHAVSAPRDEIERRLVAIWEQLLQTNRIGIDQNFFEMGGHSVLAVSLVTRIEQAFGRLLPVSVLFQSPTIAKLAEVLRAEVEIASNTPLVPIRTKGAGRPMFCVAGGGGNVLYYYPLGHAVASDRPFYGLQSLGLDGRCEPLTRVEDMARACIASMLEVQPEGPYLLAGHCFGSWVALEIAQQLLCAGKTVERLVVIDAPAPSAVLYERSLQPKTLDEHIVYFAGILAESSGIAIQLTHADVAPLADDDKVALLGAALRRAGLLPGNADSRQVQGMLDVFIANSTARYLPQAVERLPVSLFRAGEFHPDYDYSPADDPGHGLVTSTLGWHAYADGAVSVDVVPGNHITMMASPHVEQLAAAVTQRIAI
jgi:amino acid adenylation domain-containing protein